MYLHADAKLGLAGRFALVRAIEGGLSLKAAVAVFNTGPFYVSGHPAMNVPCARSEGLPVGMMLIGRHWEDATVLRAAHAFEQLGLYA